MGSRKGHLKRWCESVEDLPTNFHLYHTDYNELDVYQHHRRRGSSVLA